MKNKKGKPAASEEPKRSHHKKVLVPVPLNVPVPVEEIVIVAVPMEPVKVAPLVSSVTFRGIIAAKETLWKGTKYLFVLPDHGHELPDLLETGQTVDITVSPAHLKPANGPDKYIG